MNMHYGYLRQTTSQRGQALVEGLVILLVLLVLWVGIAWLGRLQDMGLQAVHGSRMQHSPRAATWVIAP